MKKQSFIKLFTFTFLLLGVLCFYLTPPISEATSCHRCSVINGCQMTDFESNDNCANPAGAVTRYPDPSCGQVAGGDNSMCSQNLYDATDNPIGYLDQASCTQVTGWACDKDNYNYPIDVQLFKNGSYFTGGTSIARVSANVPREAAVGALCGGNSAHGFVFNLAPGTLNNSDTVYVHAINIGKGSTNPLVTYSGKTVTCSTGQTPSPTPTPTAPFVKSCGRCSVVNGCEWTQFQSTDNCANPIGDVTRTTDTVNCKPLDQTSLQQTGGNNNRCPAPPPAPAPLATCTGASAEATTITQVKDTVIVKAFGIKNTTLVKFPTWTAYAPNGADQDDLKWNNGTKVASDPVNGDTWQYTVNLKEYNFGPSGKGLMNVHVYMDNASKINQWCGTANFTYAPAASTQSQAPTAPPVSPTPVCQPIPADNSTMDLMVNAPSAGAYTMWVRMMKPNDGVNSIYVKTGTDCPVVVSMKSGLPNNSWQWVNYKNGDANNTLTAQFKQGDQFIKLAGKDGIRVDKVMLLNNGCVPQGTGDNCTPLIIPPASTDESTHNPIGWQDTATCQAISGWTCDPDEPETALTVHVYKGASYFDGGRDIIGAVVANQNRPDLVTNGNVCNGTTAHGFTFYPPAGSLQNGDKVFIHAINVGRGTTNPLLGNTGQQVTCSTAVSTSAQIQGQPQVQIQPTAPVGQVQVQPTTSPITPTPTPAGIIQTVLALPAKVVRTVVTSTQSLFGQAPTPTPTVLPTPVQKRPNDSFVQPTITTPVQKSSTQTGVTLSLQLHGIGRGGDSSNPESGGNKNPRTRELRVAIEVLQNNKGIAASQGTVSYDATTGLFTGTLLLPALTDGSYTLRIKVNHFLKKIYPTPVQITQHMTTILPPLEMVTGDVNNDNRIDNKDVTSLLSCVSSGISEPKNCAASTKANADLNDDGKIDSSDYTLLLRENKVKTGE